MLTLGNRLNLTSARNCSRRSVRYRRWLCRARKFPPHRKALVFREAIRGDMCVPQRFDVLHGVPRPKVARLGSRVKLTLRSRSQQRGRQSSPGGGLTVSRQRLRAARSASALRLFRPGQFQLPRVSRKTQNGEEKLKYRQRQFAVPPSPRRLRPVRSVCPQAVAPGQGFDRVMMKQILLATAAALTASAIGASASDLPPSYIKAPLATVYDWTGFYVGGTFRRRFAAIPDELQFRSGFSAWAGTFHFCAGQWRPGQFADAKRFGRSGRRDAWP